MYNPGDILFYAEVPTDIIDVAIADWTASKLVHTAIAISGVQKVEALMNGVMLTTIVEDQIAVAWVNPHPGIYIVQALSWLHGMIGQPYGYGDVIEAVLYRMQHNMVINVGDHFDCSALATEFLLKEGGVTQLAQITNPHEITPSALYTLLTGEHR